MTVEDSDFVCVLFLVLLAGGLGFLYGQSAGHESGVKDHAAGRYVVVDLPDGTQAVVKVKVTK